MNHIDILTSTIIITLFCLGIRTLISDGMIFHFIRKPFESESEIMYFLREKLRKRTLNSEENPVELRKKYVRQSVIIKTFLKPFLICVVCFSSFWGAMVFIGINNFEIVPLLISCISSAFLIKVINDKVDF